MRSFKDMDPGIVIWRGALMGGKAVELGPVRNVRLQAPRVGREVACVVKVNGYWKDWEDGKVDLAQ